MLTLAAIKAASKLNGYPIAHIPVCVYFCVKIIAMSDYRSIALVRKYKSQGVGLVLTGLLGGLGLFYSTIMGAIIMLVIEFIIGYAMGKYIADVNNNLLGYYWGVRPEYNIAGYLIALAVIRVVGLIVSYITVKEHNESIDHELISMADPNHQKISNQLKDADEYVNRSDDNRGTVIVIISLIVVVFACIYLYNTPEKDLSNEEETFQSGDVGNNNTYKVKADKALVFYSPDQMDNSEYYYEKDMVFMAIKERNGFIYVSGNDEDNLRTVYGWLRLSDMEYLNGCMH